MTWTAFEHQAGRNETDDLAPGRGGYKYVLVPTGEDTAVEFWESKFDRDPRDQRFIDHHEPEYSSMEQAWAVTEYDDPDDARAVCGEKTLEKGGIGVPMTELFTWNELNGRLDVWVVTADEVNDEV